MRQCCADLDERGKAQHTIGGAMKRDQNAVQIGIFSDPF
jgi:hypothetical protein